MKTEMYGYVRVSSKDQCEVQIATFCGQQGRISRTIRAILSGQL